MWEVRDDPCDSDLTVEQKDNLSGQNNSPVSTAGPWDRGRDGFLDWGMVKKTHTLGIFASQPAWAGQDGAEQIKD